MYTQDIAANSNNKKTPYTEHSSLSLEPRKRINKRQRILLSCDDCHLRKIKCNRGQPCSSCIRYSNSDTCTYEKRNKARKRQKVIKSERILRQEVQQQQPFTDFNACNQDSEKDLNRLFENVSTTPYCCLSSFSQDEVAPVGKLSDLSSVFSSQMTASSSFDQLSNSSLTTQEQFLPPSFNDYNTPQFRPDDFNSRSSCTSLYSTEDLEASALFDEMMEPLLALSSCTPAKSKSTVDNRESMTAPISLSCNNNSDAFSAYQHICQSSQQQQRVTCKDAWMDNLLDDEIRCWFDSLSQV